MQASGHRGAAHLAFAAGRYSTKHIVAGLALAGAALAVSNLHAAGRSPGPRRPGGLAALVWPPLFSALTLGGLHIWTAPPSRQRTRALTLWGLLTAFNALWMAIGARRLGGPLTTAVATAGTAAAFAWQASGMRPTPAPRGNPSHGWRALASGVRLRRREAPQPTMH